MMIRRTDWISDNENDSGIIILAQYIIMRRQGKYDGFCFVGTADMPIFSCYLSDIEEHMHGQTSSTILAGDFNAESTQWGMHFTDRKGSKIGECLAQTNLIILKKAIGQLFRSRTPLQY